MLVEKEVYREKEVLLKEYNLFKKKGIQFRKEDKLEESLFCFEYAATIAWKYPILYNFIDEDLEYELNKISNVIFKNIVKKNESTNNSNRVVLYSGQIVDKGALTEQYLHYFIQNGFEVLLIVPNVANTHKGKGILKYIKEEKKASIFIPESKSLTSKILEIYNVVLKYNPIKAFLHFLPNDIVGYCVFFKLDLKRFYIVHNDHTFWLGKLCSDYFIEFRDFGVSLSVNRRKISKKYFLLIPFYPIIDEIEKFNGFPFDATNKIIGVSGANLNKYYMDPDLNYFKIIKELICENENFIFILCGWGNEAKVHEFIEDNGLEERFYFLGKRNDFFEVVSKSDILFESYPLKGGLVTLFAIEKKIPVIGIADYNTASGSLEDFYSLEGYKQPVNFSEFKDEANRLINDIDYRVELGNLLAKNRFNKIDFNSSMKKLMKDNYDISRPNSIKPLKINDLLFLTNYLKLGDISTFLAFSKLNTVGKTYSGFHKIKAFINLLIFSKMIKPRVMAGLFLNIFIRKY